VSNLKVKLSELERLLQNASDFDNGETSCGVSQVSNKRIFKFQIKNFTNSQNLKLYPVFDTLRFGKKNMPTSARNFLHL